MKASRSSSTVVTRLLRAPAPSCCTAVLALAAALSSPALAQGRPEALSPGMFAFEENPMLEYDPHVVLVRFHEATPDFVRWDAADMLGGEILHSYTLVPGLEKVSTLLPVQDAVAMLRTLPYVEFAEPDYVISLAGQPNDTHFDNLWGLHNTGQDIRGTLGIVDADIDAPEAWDTSIGQQNFVIAVLDTGIKLDHADLADNLWTNPGETPGNGVDDDGNGYIDDVNGWDFHFETNDPTDTNGHGTLVSGVIGARGDNGIGVTGVMQRCRIMPLKIFGPDGAFTSDSIEAIEYAVDKGVLVSNSSWGSNNFSNALRSAIDAAGAAGHLFIAAAGNDNSDNDVTPFYPSSYDLANIIAVAATTNRDERAGFSNWGATSVDLGAPGRSIYSTNKNGAYSWASGTSVASPYVAGVAAHVFAANPGWNMTQVRSHIFDTVRPIDAMNGITVTGGMVNLFDALNDSVETPPDAPGRPRLTHIRGIKVLVEWRDNSDNERRFIIQRQERVNGRWRNSTTFKKGADVTSMYNRAGHGLFRYRVRARNRAGVSDWSRWNRIDIP